MDRANPYEKHGDGCWLVHQACAVAMVQKTMFVMAMLLQENVSLRERLAASAPGVDGPTRGTSACG